PSQFAALDTDRIAGIALVRGGPTAHVAILAAGIGLPMIVALGTPLEAMAEGTSLLLDCDAGFVRIEPDAQARAGLEIAMARRA
ncbi:phosphoenolpyruvate--protein phosphotransferase, partial [Escherichia coli]|nr:phosphoenolpyruvate--protein phosphotransferase [Escherichia coli]